MPQKSKIKDNPSAFKHWINAELLKKIAAAIKSAHPEFDTHQFLSIEAELKNLELKPRVRHVSKTLYELLPKDYPKTLSLLLKSVEKSNLNGFDLWPYTEFVQTYGIEHFEPSMNALYVLTQKFTAEFAVRPFLIRYQSQALKKLDSWAKDPNHHVRRWVSEGTRTRLPWGEKLPAFIKDPKPTLKLINQLKYDNELSVRKSVANHLNDIAKDNPQAVIETLHQWEQSCPKVHQDKIAWIKRHSLRSLIKKGNPQALKLMGVNANTAIHVQSLKINQKQFKLGQNLEFSFCIQSKSPKKQKLIIDYIVHHVKSNQTTSPKVFKLKTIELDGKQKMIVSKKHSLKPVTTRKYYSGKHAIEIQINGKPYAKASWDLKA